MGGAVPEFTPTSFALSELSLSERGGSGFERGDGGGGGGDSFEQGSTAVVEEEGGRRQWYA
jgi:hypothetical protein